MAVINNNTKHSKQPMLRQRTDRAWFSRLLRHPVRKRSGSLFLQPRSTHRATKHRQLNNTLKQTTRGYWLENKNSAIDKNACNTKWDINYSLITISPYKIIHSIVKQFNNEYLQLMKTFITFIMRPSSLGGGLILRRTLSVRLSVCLSVCPSIRPVIVFVYFFLQ